MGIDGGGGDFLPVILERLEPRADVGGAVRRGRVEAPCPGGRSGRPAVEVIRHGERGSDLDVWRVDVDAGQVGEGTGLWRGRVSSSQ